MNPADIIKDAVALIKEYAQELSQKEQIIGKRFQRIDTADRFMPAEMMLNPGN